MTIAEMSEWFDLISDKIGSPYFPSTEKSLFINRATKAFVDKLLNPKEMETDRYGEKHGYEKDDVTSRVLSSLVETCEGTTEAGGTILISDLEANLGDIEIIKIESVSRDGYAARFVRHNDYPKFKANSFLKAKTKDPIYRLFSNQIKIEPIGAFPFQVTVIRQPRTVSIDDNISSDLPDICHNEIMKIALGFAGISYRDEFLYAAQTKE